MTTCVYETDVLFSESTLSYLLEAGPEVKQSALSKMISKVKELLEKLKRFIQETVFKKRVKVVEDAVKKNPELGEKEVKVIDIDKKLKVEEEFVKDLKKAKTPADVEKAKAKRKKALKIAAVAAAAITIAAGLLHIKNTKTRTKNLCDEYQKLLDLADDSIRQVNTAFDDYSRKVNTASTKAKEQFLDSKNYSKLGLITNSDHGTSKQLHDARREHGWLSSSPKRLGIDPADTDDIKLFAKRKTVYDARISMVRTLTEQINTSMTETMKTMGDVTETHMKALQSVLADE